MAWINLKNGDCIQTSTICNVRGFGTPTETAIDLVSTETVCVDESCEEVRALIDAAEEAEQRRNARIVADVQSSLKCDLLISRDRATEAEAQLAEARDERDAWEKDALRGKGLIAELCIAANTRSAKLAQLVAERDAARAEAELLRGLLSGCRGYVEHSSPWCSSAARFLQVLDQELVKGAE